MKQRNLTLIATVASILLVLLAAYGLDRWVARAQEEAAASFLIVPAVRTAVVANLFLALFWLMLARFAWARNRHGRLIPFLYLAIGGLILVAPVTGVGGQMPAMLLPLAGPASRVGMTGALLAAIGVGLLSAAALEEIGRKQ